MFGSDRGDRGALVALAIVVIAVLIITLFGTGSPFEQIVGQPASDYIKASQNADVAQSITSSNNFNPWLDSYAQWGMALLSIAATFVSIWAVRLLRKTLAETQAATKAAQASADAAAETNRTTREIGEAQVRAYVMIEGGTFDFSKSEEGQIGVIHLSYSNTGQSPAFNLLFELGLRLIKRSNPNFPAAAIPDMEHCQIPSRMVTTVAPRFDGKVTLGILKSSFASEWLQRISKGQVTMMLDGFISWTDVFKKTETVRIVGIEITARDYFSEAPPVGVFHVSNMRQEKPQA